MNLVSSKSRYVKVISQHSRWGPLKWYGYLETEHFIHGRNEWVAVLRTETGWFSWSRSWLEWKLDRAIRRRQRSDHFRDASERIPAR